LDDATRSAFAADPAEALRQELGLKVRPVESLATVRGDGGFCDGMSYLEDGVVLYAPTPNSRRENFTLAHELGHWIVEQDEGLFGWIADQENAAALLESVCDRVAQRLLLPEGTIARVLGSGPIRAAHVLELFENSSASWQACAIALARRLRGLAAVVLISRWDLSVQHASIQPDPDDGWPKIYPWRGQVLQEAHPLATLKPGATLTRRLSWRASWGSEVEFFADAFAEDRRVVAVFADQDIWKAEPGRVLAPREYDQRPTGTIFCCGLERVVRGYPCGVCGQQFCPVCKQCQCDRNAKDDVQCTGCWLLKRSNLVVNGLCDACRS
jgi:Zn-dependent peptidase ImmA (M78 family)